MREDSVAQEKDDCMIWHCKRCGAMYNTTPRNLNVIPNDTIVFKCPDCGWEMHLLVRDSESLGRKWAAVMVRIHRTRLSGFVHRNIRRLWRKCKVRA